jgi:hypothetical protein
VVYFQARAVQGADTRDHLRRDLAFAGFAAMVFSALLISDSTILYRDFHAFAALPRRILHA